jgi:hypothetical protein
MYALQQNSKYGCDIRAMVAKVVADPTVSIDLPPSRRHKVRFLSHSVTN